MCREGDGVDVKDGELRDIHHRIDALQAENERQYSALTDKLHNLEVAVARGSRFPASAWVAAAAILLSVLGSGAVLYSELQVSKHDSAKALVLIEDHLKGAPVHRMTVQRLNEIVDQWYQQIPLLDERVKSLEARIVGAGPNGWHRSDHDNFAKAVEAQMDALRHRVESLEAKRR